MYNQPYNFNPYMQTQYNRIDQQSPLMNGQRPPMTGLNGKMVDSVEVVKAMDIPMDGSVSYFPISDGSEIVTKQLQLDGTSKIVVYRKLVEEQKPENRYITLADFDTLRNEIKEIKDLVINNVQQPVTND